MVQHLISKGSAPSCEDMLELFIAAKEGVGKADRTIGGYRESIGRRFLPFCPESVRDLSADHVILFLAAQRRSGLAASSINLHQRTVNVWLRWLYKRKYLERDITQEVDRVEVPKKKQRSVGSEDMTRLLSVLINPKRPGRGGPRVDMSARNMAIIRLLFASGLRRGELVALDLADVDMGNSIVHTPTLSAKDREYRRVPFDAATKEALLTYIIQERGKKAGPLFLSRDGERMTGHAVAQMVMKVRKLAGVDVSAHAFRRGFAANVRVKGMDIGHTMTLLGHTSVAMTMLYSAQGEMDAAIEAYRGRIG